MLVGVSRPSSSGLALVATSTKLGELKGFATPDALELSSCSLGFASASFHSPDSVSRESFQELVATGNVTAMDFTFSTLKKSLFNQFSGLGSMLARGSEMRRTFSESLPVL